MGPKKLLQLHFYFVVLLLCSCVCAKPAPALFRDEKIEKQQELVGKIVDLIKREQIRMNLIEDDSKAEILNEKSVREEIENAQCTEVPDIQDEVKRKKKKKKDKSKKDSD